MIENESVLVSVIIPCYNHEQFIQKSIQSIIDQDYENIELIIIDDGSKDKSVTKIQEMYSQCVKRFIRFEFRSRPNIGLSATLNEALEWVKGDYWAPCASDDFYHKNRVSSQIDFFLENKFYDFCVTKSYVVNDIDEVLLKQTESYNSNLNKEIKFNDVFTFKVHLPVTGMYNTGFFRSEIGFFDTSLAAEDYDLNLKLVNQVDIGIVHKKLYYYRSPGAVGGSRKRKSMRIEVSESHLKTINKYSNHSAYKQALKEWNYRRFIFFSPYTDTKIYAFKGMLFSIRKINKLDYYKSWIKLILIWK